MSLFPSGRQGDYIAFSVQCHCKQAFYISPPVFLVSCPAFNGVCVHGQALKCSNPEFVTENTAFYRRRFLLKCSFLFAEIQGFCILMKISDQSAKGREIPMADWSAICIKMQNPWISAKKTPHFNTNLVPGRISVPYGQGFCLVMSMPTRPTKGGKAL